MNKEDVLNFLTRVQHKTYIGVASLELIQFVIDKGLVDRTTIGNFRITKKGNDFLGNKISLDELILLQ